MFIPIKDDVPTIRKPVVTIALIAINSVVFLFSILLGDRGFLEFTYKFAYIPVELVHAVEVTPELAFSTYLTPFTSMFMHGGWLHLIGNMLFLWIYGNNVEDYFGGIKFVFFYLLSGLDAIANLAFVNTVGMGARRLRAETAAISAIACWQALIGDWRAGGPAATAK